MICPACGSDKHEIKESRSRKTSIYRRRVCNSCSHRWSTTETIIKNKETDPNMIELDRMIASIRKELDQ